MHRRALALIFAIVLPVLGAVLLGTVLWTHITELHKGFEGSEQFVEVPAGASATEVRRRLVDAGVVRDDLTARAALWWTGHAQDLKAGEYRFTRQATALEVFERIARGDVYTRRLTFREGLTIAEMSREYEAARFGPAEAFVRAAGKASLVTDLDPDATDLEGYLFPETYTLSRTTSADDLVAAMVQGFRRGAPDLKTRAASQGFTVRQIMSLAALIEKETGKADERPLVAAVYRNRLRLRMPMQADPTVVYALMKAGRYDGNIRKADLAFDSPYNTYRYPNLPPGPIAAPGAASIAAALAPADVDYLYFVSRNDGSHVFAETLSAHNANVQEHQVRYFREQRQRGK